LAVEELNRRSLSEQAEQSAKRIRPKAEVGGTGLEVFGGVIGGKLADYQQEWLPPRLYDTADKMRRGDATCHATLLACTLPVLNTEIQVLGRPPRHVKEDSAVEEAAEFLRWMLYSGEMRRTWKVWLRECVMLGLAYGHMIFEPVWDVTKNQEHSGGIILRDLASRHPRTIDKWHFEDNGQLSGVTQRIVRPSGKTQDVDLEIPKLVVFTNGEEAGNPLGQSILRAAWKHWKFKDGFYSVQAIATERQGAGIPFAEYPQGSPTEYVDDTESMLQSFAANEQAYLMWEEGWQMGLIDMKASTVLDPEKAIDHHDAMIPKSILAGFLNLTQSTKGSYALSADHSNFFAYSLQYVAHLVEQLWNQSVIPPIIEKNFPGLPYYPRVKFDQIGDISLKDFLGAVGSLATDGVLTPDITLENRVRELLNLEPIDEAEFEEAHAIPDPEEGFGDADEGASGEDDSSDQED
jgi:hypothetical protein